MPHQFFFHQKIVAVVAVRLDDQRDPPSDFDAGAFQRGHFFGVVGDELDAFDAQTFEDCDRRAVLPRIDLEAKVGVRVGSV